MRKRRQFIVFVSALCVVWIAELNCPGIAVSQDQKSDFSVHETLEKAAFLRLKGKYQEAAQVCQKIIERQAKTGESNAIGRVWFELGRIKWNLGKPDEARELLRKAEEQSERSQDLDISDKSRKTLKIIELYYRGKKLSFGNRTGEAVRAFDQAIEISRHASLPEFELKCLRQKAISFWHADDLRAFLKTSEAALELAQKLNHRLEIARNLNNISVYYIRVKDYSYALKYLSRAVKFLEEDESDREERADIYYNLAFINTELGNFNAADKNLLQAINIELASGQRVYLALTYTNYGLMKYQHFKATKEVLLLHQARSFLEKALDLLIDASDAVIHSIHAYNNLAITHYQFGDYDKAQTLLEAVLRRSKETSYQGGIQIASLNLGDVFYKKKNHKKAMAYYLQVIKEADPVTRSALIADAYLGLGKCLEIEKDFEKALESYRQAQEFTERVRNQIAFDFYRMGFARDKYESYARALDILYRFYLQDPSEDRFNQIVSQVERTKAQSFVSSLLGKMGEDFGSNEDTVLTAEKHQVSRKIASVFMNLVRPDISEKNREQLAKALVDQEEQYLRVLSEERLARRDKAGQPMPVNWTKSLIEEEFLDESTAFLEYAFGQEQTYLIYITRKKSGILALPEKTQIEELVKTFKKALLSPKKDSFKNNIVVKNITSRLTGNIFGEDFKGISKLIISPEGVLNYLPFECLALESKNGNGAAFIVEQFDVCYAPSATVLYLLKKVSRPAEPEKILLAFAAPRYKKLNSVKNKRNTLFPGIERSAYLENGFNFHNLPFSKKEVLEIARYFPEEKVKVHLGERASEANLKKLDLRNYRILHFACHGLLDERFPLRSALVLTPSVDEMEDGFLQTREIYSLRLNADLVTLSACQSGRGGLEVGEGLMGLPRTFFYAGAKAVVATLWSVEDKYSSRFMKFFYGYLLQGESKSRALRLAKIKMLQSSASHPFFWASFVLSGDPGPIFSGIGLKKF